MACGSGCCKPAVTPPSPPTEAPAPAPAPAPVTAPSPTDQQQKAGSSKIDEDDCQDSCCNSVAEEPKCEDSGSGCCASPLPGDDGCKKTTTTDKSPASKEAIGTESGCKSGCCAAPPKPVTPEVIDPPCCKGKASPCCDTSCLDRLAQRSCDRDSQCDTRSEDGEPCSKHKRTTRERFALQLEAIGCICRALIALGQESCCMPPERSRSAVDTSRRRSKKSRASIDTCCGAPATATATASPNETCGKSAVKPSKDSCCISSRRPSTVENACAKGCCGQPKAVKPPSLADSCADEACCGGEKDACCGGEKDTCCDDEKELGIPTKIVAAVAATDPEKGLGGSEHIVLSISGMTCTGCETKLSRTLAGVPGISNLKASLVLSRAEFDLNVAVNSVTSVTKHLERTTEFTCERIINEGSTIDIIPPGSPEEFIKQDFPLGVTEMTLVGKDVVRVAFDAKVIGARDLCSQLSGQEEPKLAPPRADPALEAGSKHVRHLGFMTLFSAILTIPVLVLAWAPLPDNEIAYGSASLALATIIQVVVAGPFYPKSFKSLVFSRIIEMDLLIVLSTSAAYVFSVVAFGYLVSGKPLSTGEFFETSTLLVTLIMVGRYVGALARQKAVESISIRSLQTTETILVDSGRERSIDTRLLQYGDCFKVMADSRVPTDGTVITGISEVDESMITGESRPVVKEKGSNVIAGSINTSGPLVVRLTRLPEENTISTIAVMVDEAKLSKPKIQDLADKVASYFVPVVLLLTIITFVSWVGRGINARGLSGSDAVVNAITFAITVLIVSCPCAIGLAVPMVIVIATGVAADRGVIFKTAESIEIAHKTSHVVFDKTGTLTEGKLTVVAETWADGVYRDPTTVGLLLGLVGSNKHPVSSAVAALLKSISTTAMEVKDPKTIPGKGVEGTCPSGRVLRAGNSRWLGVTSEPMVMAVLEKGYTAFCFTIDGKLAVVFGLEDTLRPDSLDTVSALQARGITVSLLSGDDDGAVRDVATRLNLVDPYVRSRCTPADKRAYIQELLASTPSSPTLSSMSLLRKLFRKKPKAPVVMFCGDGTNDAVALAQATIGVHMNEGTDVAQAAADVVLVRPRIGGVLTVIGASRAAVHRIAFNFTWSFVYNIFAVLLAAGAFGTTARIPPEFAGLGEIVSVLPVIAAAVALRWAKI